MHGWVGSLVKSACFDDSGKLSREKAFAKSISGKYNFCRENFTDFSLMLQTDTTPPNFVEKTFTNSHKPLKIHKSFLPQTFPAVRQLEHSVETSVSYFPYSIW